MTLNFKKAAGDAVNNNSNGGNSRRGNEDRKPSEYWLNFGVMVELPDENGELVETFASCVGAPLDQLKQLEATANAKLSWRCLVEVKNAMAAQIKEVCDSLKPGEAKVFGDGPIQVEIRRKAAAAAQTTEGTNPALQQVAGMFSLAGGKNEEAA